MGIFDFLKKPKRYQLSEKALRWNKFIDEICNCELSILNKTQKIAVLAFWYDAEMHGGGHSGYFDCYPDTIPDELESALIEIGAADIAVNYRIAISTGEIDDYIETDNAFYNFQPSLTDLLMSFVEEHKCYIF